MEIMELFCDFLAGFPYFNEFYLVIIVPGSEKV